MSFTIELEQRIISKDMLVITSSHTCYANDKRVSFTPAAELLKRYSQAIKDAKAKGAKISYKNRVKALLLSLKEDTPALIELYHERFDKQVVFWESQIHGDTFNSDQLESFNQGYEMRNELRAMFYRSEPLSKLLEVQHTIETIEERINRPGESLTGATFYL